MAEDRISFIPRYHETPDQAAEYLRLTLPLLSKHRLPVNPVNYAIGYDYVAGNNRPLREAIDRLQQTHQPLTPELCIRFYKEYILDEAARRFEKVGDSLQHLVGNTLSEVEKTETQAGHSAATLEQQAALLQQQEPAQIAEVLQNVIQETRNLAAAGSELRSNLQATNREIHQLRAELEMMKEAAFTDALTGLLNRRAFDMKIQQLLANAPVGTSFLLLLDLDHFKKINDQYGHLTGDKVLRFTAEVIRKHLPPGQIAARYGGEEMAVLLQGFDRAQALRLAEQIRETLAKSRLKRRDNEETLGQVTLSIGIAGLEENDTVDSLIERADQALYEAKRQGRNRVIDDRGLIRRESS
ncbi:diguanylate cyclase [Methylomarinovum caldicuralii]|uniref:diguanylate cyclase n=1 Tax=Methylomarinovum caldicuralii TaxID=438856 RepID=A0AAU9CBX2_9GAMM|nr:GGDEF domain-containing protein [Methylomarinovum caldicuralii]BCX82039.1 diguanylate cyclase [Methylomarinovum caldicuralii]